MNTATASHPLAYTVEDFAALTGLGRTRLYEAIKNRQLLARKYGKRTVILAEDGRAFLASLPEQPARSRRMRDDEFERSTFVEFVRVGAMLDRMLGQCRDRDLAAKLAAVRRPVSAVVDALAERCEMWRVRRSSWRTSAATLGSALSRR